MTASNDPALQSDDDVEPARPQSLTDPQVRAPSPEEIVDLLQGGQGVFGIAVGGSMREITGTLAEFPAERLDGDTVVAAEQRGADELAARRQARSAG